VVQLPELTEASFPLPAAGVESLYVFPAT